MTSQSADQSSEIKDLLHKISATLKIRAITLASFLVVVSIFWLLNLFPYTHYVWLTVGAIALWLASAFGFKALVEKGKTVSGIENLYFIYSAIFELGLLSIIVFTNGGITWIGAIFYLFTIIYSNIVLPRMKGNLISLIAFLWFGELALLQYLRVLPFFPYIEFNEMSYLNTNYFVTTLSFIFLAFVLSGISASSLTGLLKRRTAELENLKSQLEETKVVLGIRVRARTRELKELADGLEDQVEERTKELEDKMNDLKMFQTLSVDRELKMVELKKEIEKLKEAEISSVA